ncbi:MAG: carboxypeptidase-like regulatory domain-containing protein [Gemmatimonadaceae bacterium]|nr:carboxypeptidase-like regulatory domain-containing protein [Gemmatimonadaceae bacterium]
MSRAAAMLVLLVAAPGMLAAQRLRVRVIDATTGTGVVGALVAAVDSSGQVVGEGLSQRAGERVVPLPAAGRYRLRVRRIGTQPYLGEAIRVGTGETRDLLVELHARGQRLSTVRVTRDAVCGRAPDGDTRLAELFEQLATALDATALSRADTMAQQRLLVREVERELGAQGSLVAQRVTREGRGTGRSFVAVPAERLEQEGFVIRERDGGFRFFAPDERVLTSDAFARTHCFALVPDDSAGLQGVRFRPAPGRRRPDIEGVAWIDSASGEPRRLDFAYVFPRALLPVRAPRAGGEVHFERLLDGSWYLPQWLIRMPLFGETDQGTKVVIAGYLEVGGYAAPIDAARSRVGTVLPPLRGVTILARVVDEQGIPVHDAMISRDSTAGAVRTDTAGMARLLLPDTGTVTVHVRRVGVRAVDTTLAITQPGAQPLAIVARRVQQLAAVGVTARTLLETVGFTRRRTLGSGWFMDSTAIRRRNALSALTLVVGMPGIELMRVPSDVEPPTDDGEFRQQWVPGTTIPVMRTSANTPWGARVCLPLLVVNGRLTTPAELQALQAGDVVALELYQRPTQVPMEYRRMKVYDTCGAVLFWTSAQR